MTGQPKPTRIRLAVLASLRTITWNEAEIGGRKCASIHFEQKRLYVVERFGKVEAWIDGVRVGSYADLPEAKEAILKIRRPKFSPTRTGL